MLYWWRGKLLGLLCNLHTLQIPVSDTRSYCKPSNTVSHLSWSGLTTWRRNVAWSIVTLISSEAASRRQNPTSATEDTTQHADLLWSLQRTVQSLVAKSDDAENCLRENNFQVLGLPLGAEGDCLCRFYGSLLKKYAGPHLCFSHLCGVAGSQTPHWKGYPWCPSRNWTKKGLELQG